MTRALTAKPTDKPTLHALDPAVVALRAWRTRHMVTQATAADMLGVPLRTLQHWELTGRCALPGLLTLALRHLNGECGYTPKPAPSSDGRVYPYKIATTPL